MTSSRQAIQVAAKLYDAQEQLLRLLGPIKYRDTIAPYVESIKRGLEKNGGDLMTVGLKILKELEKEGGHHMTMWKVMAALVEIAEENQ